MKFGKFDVKVETDKTAEIDGPATEEMVHEHHMQGSFSIISIVKLQNEYCSTQNEFCHLHKKNVYALKTNNFWVIFKIIKT